MLLVQLRSYQYCRISLNNIRLLSTRNKERRKYQQQKYENKSNNDSNLPEFQVLLRQLYKKSHPDLLRSSFPSESIINDNSMQLLNRCTLFIIQLMNNLTMKSFQKWK